MRRALRLTLALAIGASAVVGLAAQTGFLPWRQPDGSSLSGFVLNCATGQGREALPCGGSGAPLLTMAMPFVRATQSPFVFPFTTTPQQFLITQPAGTNTYRAFNPCVHAHVRITSVRALAPVVSEPTAYPGVRRVTSATEVVDRLTGYRFGPGAETLGSATNPMGGAERIVSGMIVPITGYQADLTGVTCEFELGYGQSG